MLSGLLALHFNILLQTTYSLGSISHGTIFAIYMLGMFFPWVTSSGALAGGVASAAVVSWLSFGTQLAIGSRQISFPTKSFSVEGCTNATQLIMHTNATSLMVESVIP